MSTLKKGTINAAELKKLVNKGLYFYLNCSVHIIKNKKKINTNQRNKVPKNNKINTTKQINR